MDIASLVLGIISVILSLFCGGGCIGYITAPVGLILGLVHYFTKCKNDPTAKKGMAIAGIVLSLIALIIMFALVFVIGAASFSL